MSAKAKPVLHTGVHHASYITNAPEEKWVLSSALRALGADSRVDDRLEYIETYTIRSLLEALCAVPNDETIPVGQAEAICLRTALLRYSKHIRLQAESTARLLQRIETALSEDA